MREVTYIVEIYGEEHGFFEDKEEAYDFKHELEELGWEIGSVRVTEREEFYNE